MGRGGSILFWVVVAGTASWPVRVVVSYAWSAWQSSRCRASAFELVAHGLCSIFHDMGPWTPSDLILGVSALAKITEKQPPNIPGKRLDDLAQDPCFLVEAQHWRSIAEAAYTESAIQWSLQTGLPESSILYAKWSSCPVTLCPAHIVAIDAAFGAIVLAIRGTRDMVDVLVDLAASPFFFSGSWCHRGFTHSATVLLDDVRGYLLKALEDHPSFQVVCIGHSLGAGVATFSAFLLREEKINARCWAFSPPACVDEQLASLCASFTTSILCNHDLIPRFSAASVEQLREEICRFDWDKVQELEQSDDSWRMLANAASSMKRLQNLYLEASRRVQGLEKHRYDLPLKGLAFLQRESKNGRYLESKIKENMKVVQLFPPGRLIVLSWFFHRKPKALAIFRTYSKLEILRPAKTRFAYMIIAMKRLIKVQDSLRQTVLSDAWKAWPGSKEPDALKVQQNAFHPKMWTLAESLMKTLQPIYNVLRLSDSEGCTLGLIYEFMDKVGESLNQNSSPCIRPESMPPGTGAPVIRFGAPFIRRYGVAPTYVETCNITWSMSEARTEDFQKIIVSQWCLSDHMLSTIGIALDSLQRKAPSLLSVLRRHPMVE